ncbi:MAG: helix-turn-helix domain-containing protein [Gordonia sp. (in: high G+C Gram-positive bacteria)]
MIAHSWRRSELSGVRPGDAPPVDSVALESADTLLDAARPVLDDAAVRLQDTGVSLLLVDHDCRMVSRIALGAAVENTLDRLGAAPGHRFDESAVGTTGLGTTAEIRGGITVNGSEHYLERFKHLSCFGLPIIHPATRRFAGSLCLTDVGPRSNPLAVPFVTGIVGDIADRLLDRSRAHQRRLLDAFQHAAPRRDLAVAALGDDLQLTNSLAAQLLSSTDLGALRTIAADPALTATTLRLVLTSGTAVQIVAEPVSGARGAALFFLRPTPTPRSTPSARTTRHAAAVAVTGEPGTGRTTAARELAADFAETAAPPLVVDVAAALLAGTPPDFAALAAQARSTAAALVIDGVELLGDTAVTLLRHLAGTARPESPLLVVSAPAAECTPGVGALLTRCGRRVDLPPLRRRTDELTALAAAVIGDLHPGLDLSGAAADALLSHDWPGNLTELVTVLERASTACRARSARTIKLADLPAPYRASSRAAHLAGLEQAERQAIIDALERCDGNKVHAARELGISRTTLYARIRALDV